MDQKTFALAFETQCSGQKTPVIDRFNRALIRDGIDVSYLRDLIPDHPEYHRTYFQVSMAQLDHVAARLEFVEKNFHLLQDWWHVDQLTQFLGKNQDFDLSLEKSAQYVENEMPFVRRWGYVLFMPQLVKQPNAASRILPLFKEDQAYYVQMAEAWLLCELAVWDPDSILHYLEGRPLPFEIVGKAIQKICDSYRISQLWKYRFRQLRRIYKSS